MSRSVSRRIARNAQEKDTGHRSPHGRGRFRGLNPLQAAIATAAWMKGTTMPSFAGGARMQRLFEQRMQRGQA